MRQLPDSLYGAIFDLCDVKTLLDMCHICRHLARKAQLHLFGKLSVGLVRASLEQDEALLLRQSLEKVNKIINTLLLRPDLATAVREIHVIGVVTKAGLIANHALPERHRRPSEPCSWCRQICTHKVRHTCLLASADARPGPHS